MPKVVIILSFMFFPGILIYASLREARGWIAKCGNVLMWFGTLMLVGLVWEPSVTLLLSAVVALWGGSQVLSLAKTQQENQRCLTTQHRSNAKCSIGPVAP